MSDFPYIVGEKALDRKRQGTKKYITGMWQREDVAGWKHPWQERNGSAFGSRFGERKVAEYV